MIEIIETNMGRRKVIATADTFDQAKAKVTEMKAVFLEDDEDHPNCADAFLDDGRIIAIQPEGFML